MDSKRRSPSHAKPSKGMDASQIREYYRSTLALAKDAGSKLEFIVAAVKRNELSFPPSSVPSELILKGKERVKAERAISRSKVSAEEVMAKKNVFSSTFQPSTSSDPVVAKETGDSVS